MATLATIRTRVQELVSNNSMITTSDLNTILQAEHDTLLNDYSWAARKQDVIINTVAAYSTGTVSTSGTTLTGVSTAWTSAFVNRFVRAGSTTSFDRITAFTSATNLTMESALAADVAAGSSYNIFKHLFNLPSDFGRATTCTTDIRLREWSRPDIDRIDPFRSHTATRPEVFSIHGPDPLTTTSSIYQIEFWPVPSSAQSIRIEYLRTNTLVNDTDFPLYRSDVLVWKAAESCAFFLHGKTGDVSWLSLADRFHQRYAEALQGAREDDIGKFSPQAHVHNRYFDFGRGDDYWLSRDPIWLR